MEFPMTIPMAPMSDGEAARVAAPVEEAGLGALRTERGNLPLDRIDVRAEITGLTSRVELTQDFVNAFDVPLEATYVFPLPDRGAVTAMRMTADGRVVQAQLRERAAARQAYDEAIAAGQRASIAEEERPDVFTMRVGNIAPGERVSVALTLVCPLSYQDGEASFRFPLVVAPRYIPGTALAGGAVGDGYADDTDAVPDASRITPPVLLPGFPNPVRLSIDVGIDPAGLVLSQVRSSLHAVSSHDGRLRVVPGERANRDFVLRIRYGAADFSDSLVLVPDADGEEGSYQLTVLPPATDAPPRPRDVLLVLDRSGSMAGWKMVAARRAAARIVDTLTGSDRFAALAFDHQIQRPHGLAAGLVEASDRNRYRAVEHLARVNARGGTELLAPLRDAVALLRDSHERDTVLVLVTDGQVGNENQIVRELSGDLARVRVHIVGIDRAINAGLLHRLARAGGGTCELVESEDRLDEAMDAIHRRIGAPLVRGLRLQADGLTTIDNTTTPARIGDLVPGVPLVISGRYRGTATGSIVLRGTTGDEKDWSVNVAGQHRQAPAVTAQWARAHLRDLEDSYVSAQGRAACEELEKRIVATSLRFGVLCRFTAYIAIDSRVVADGEVPHRVLQPVEAPAGWEMSPLAATTLDYDLDGIECAPAGFATPAPPARHALLRMDLDRGDADAVSEKLYASLHPEPGSRSQILRDYLDGGLPTPPAHAPQRADLPTARKPVREQPELTTTRKQVREQPELTAARKQVREQARQLRKAGAVTDNRRRVLLAELARRLRSLIAELDRPEGAVVGGFGADGAGGRHRGRRRRGSDVGCGPRGARRLRRRHGFAGREAARRVLEAKLKRAHATSRGRRDAGVAVVCEPRNHLLLKPDGSSPVSPSPMACRIAPVEPTPQIPSRLAHQRDEVGVVGLDTTANCAPIRSVVASRCLQASLPTA
jgi:hypothetical protein